MGGRPAGRVLRALGLVYTAARVTLVGISPGRVSGCCCATRGAGVPEGRPLERGHFAPRRAAARFPGRCARTWSPCSTASAWPVPLASTARPVSLQPSSSCRPCLGHRLPGVRERPELRGQEPVLTRHPVLRSLVRGSSARGSTWRQAPGRPAEKAAQDALAFLGAEGLVDPARCLLGFPHPSGANGWRAGQYAARRHQLAGEIARRAATACGRPARRPWGGCQTRRARRLCWGLGRRVSRRQAPTQPTSG